MECQPKIWLRQVMVQCVSSEADSPWTSVTMQTLPVTIRWNNRSAFFFLEVGWLVEGKENMQGKKGPKQEFFEL